MLRQCGSSCTSTPSPTLTNSPKGLVLCLQVIHSGILKINCRLFGFAQGSVRSCRAQSKTPCWNTVINTQDYLYVACGSAECGMNKKCANKLTHMTHLLP